MKILQPQTEGNYLTQSADVADTDRTYAVKIYAPDDIPDDTWREAMPEERQAWLERMDALQADEPDFEPEEEQ